MIEPLRPTMAEVAKQFRENPVVIERRKQSKTPPKSLAL
jgi:hypothetical protein